MRVSGRSGLVAGIELHVRGQRRPPVLAHGVQEAGHRADVGATGLGVRNLDGQPGQVASSAARSSVPGPAEFANPGVNREKRTMAIRSLRSWPSPIPHDMRQRHHPLGQIPQPDWLHRSEIQAGAPWPAIPRRRNSHTSRWYSLSQPVPSRRSSRQSIA